MPCPEAVEQDPEPEVDSAAAQEQRADEEEAGSENAEPRVRAVGEVLVHRARSGEPTRVEHDDVSDGEDAERGDDDRQGRIPTRADVGSRHPAEDQRDREHRPDRECLGNGVNRCEVLFAELPSRRGADGVYLAHGDILQVC